MAVDPDTIARVQAEINDLVNSSPASTKQYAEGAIISGLKKKGPKEEGPTGAMISALKRETAEPVVQPEPLTYGLGSILDGGVTGAAKDKLAALNEPIDKSVGVDIPSVDTATQKIATSRTLGTEGADNYNQYQYDLGDKRGAASSGEAVGDAYVENLRAGNAGLNIATGSTLNPIDGSDGNPAFFKGRYPLLNTTVAPFRVKIPQYNMEVTSETLDPEKLAFQVATMIGGRPVPTYVGYTNAGVDMSESWSSALTKGLPKILTGLYGLGHQAFTMAGVLGASSISYMNAGLALLNGQNSENVKKVLDQELSRIQNVGYSDLDAWNKVSDAYDRAFNLKLTRFNGYGNTVLYNAPTALSQIGVVAMLGMLTGGAGVSPVASGRMLSLLSGGLFGLAQGAEDFEGLKNAPISPQRKLGRTAVGIAGSIAINSFGLWTIFGSKIAAARQFVTNYGKRFGAAVGKGTLGMLGEGISEWGDQRLQNYITYNMGDDQAGNRLDTETMAFILGAIGGVWAIPVQIRNEKIAIAREQILAGKIAADAPEFVKDLAGAVEKLAGTGLYTKEQALEIVAGMASPEGQDALQRKADETLMTMLDRLTPEALDYAEKMGARQSAQLIKELNELDQKVYNSLPEQLNTKTRTMVSRAMQGIASVVSFYGGDFKMPKFVVRDGQPMAYEPKTNTLYINTKSTGEASDLMMVANPNLRLIDPVQRGILHELGHMLDVQLGAGTRYRDFLPTYFEAIAKVYGKDKAKNVQSKMPNEKDRTAFATSRNKEDVAERNMSKLTGEINEKDTAEYFAYALGRLGKRIGKAMGFDNSEVGQYVDAANIVAQTLVLPSIQNQLTAYKLALDNLIRKNDATLQAMAKAMGNGELARKIQQYVAGDTNALSKEDVLALYNILKTYTGIDGAKIIEDAFKGVSPETFMQRVERDFASSIIQGEETVGQLQKAINEKNKKAMAGMELLDAINESNELNEQVAYASTRGLLEGEHLDADRYYATGEARGHKGRAMRWGYGNYLNKSPVINKENYYDSFLSDALKRPRSKLHGFPRGVPDLEMDMLVAYLETKAKPGESVIYKKDDIIKELNQGVEEAKQNAEKSHKEFEEAYEEAKKYSKYYEFLGAFVYEPTESQMINMLSSDFYDTISESYAKKLFGVIDGYSFKEFKEAHEAAKKVYDARSQDFRAHDQVAVEERMKYEIEDCLTDESSIEVLPEEKVVMPEQHAFLIPDNEFFLDAQSPIRHQTKFVKDRINAIAEKYGWWDSEFILNPSSGAYDVDVSEVNGEEFYDWLAKHVASEQGFSDKVEAYRFARDVLADSGIKGIRTFGHRDMETFNVFRGEDTRKYKQLHEETIDVSEFLNAQKKKQVSSLEKRAAEKPDGLTYADDSNKVAEMMKKAGKSPKWFTKWFSNGDINTALWAMGGKDMVEHFDLVGKMNRSADRATSLMEDFDNRVKKSLGFKNNYERDLFLNQAAIDSIDVPMAVDPLTGETISMKISPLVAMNVYLHAKNPETRSNMLNAFDGNGEVMQSVIDSLTPEQKKYADEMQEFIKDNWTKYRESFRQDGDDIEEEPYWPIVEAVHAALGDRKVNSNISRKEGKNYAISLDVDAREIFNTYVQRVAGAEQHVYSTIRRLKDLFGYEKGEYSDDFPTAEYRKLSDEMWQTSKKLRGMALRNLGDEKRYDRFLSLLDDFLEKREASMVGTEALNIAARNLTGGLLQWKPIQYMKNLANATGYWGLVPDGYQNEYWRNTAWAATHPIEAGKYMMEKVPFIRNRFKGQNFDEMLTQQTAGQDSLLMNWAKRSNKLSPNEQKVVSNVVALTQAARRAGYTPMLAGDMSANVVGGYGLLKIYEKLYGDKAGDKLSEDIVNHQASSNQATRSLLQREWGRDIRGELTRFSSEGVQKIKSSAKALAQAQRGERTYGNAIKEILSTFSSMVVFALISAGVIDLFDSDDENDEAVYDALAREGLSALFGASVVGNSVIAPIFSSVFTGTKGGIGTPFTNIATSDLYKLSKGDWEDITLDGISSVVPIVGLKQLVGGGKGVYRGVTGETPAERMSGLRQALGRSKKFADEREGVKKD